jgi:hypothetical protein
VKSNSKAAAVTAGLAALAVSLLVSGGATASVPVASFSAAMPGGPLPADWELAELDSVSPTRFRIVELDGTAVLQMDAEAAAASLYRSLEIDPYETPLLRWRWRVRNPVDGADLRRKLGDDLPARLYVLFDYPLERLPFIERTKIRLARLFAGDAVPAAALCYVWDGRLPSGTVLPNAYTDRVQMVVAESGTDNLGRWVMEERDVAADFRAAFGEEPPPISGIALAADTDQTGASVRSWFGDIGFYRRP